MNRSDVEKALINAVKNETRAPVENFVINGKAGLNETEYYLDLNSNPAIFKIFDRGRTVLHCEFANPEDAAFYFFGKLFRKPNFRRLFVDSGGEFDDDAGEIEYIEAFKKLFKDIKTNKSEIELPNINSTEYKHGWVYVSFNGKWVVRTDSENYRSETSRFSDMASALEFLHWKISRSFSILD